jgi:hypothetical protein
MAELKILGKTLDEWKESSFPSKLAAAKAKAKAGQISNRVDFSDEKIGPKFRADTKPVKKITKEKVSVETPSGNIGSVDRTADVIGPDMSKVIKDVVATKPARDFTATEMAQNLMSPGYNKMKKGGSVKAKCMSKGGSTASKRADGCAMRGKTKGRMI